ncbi:MAG: hypothetical protein RLZZ555_2231 [Pseudomonadota bacterium]|jgi:UPF0755 protein
MVVQRRVKNRWIPVLSGLLLAAVLAVAAVAWWLQRPLDLAGSTSAPLELNIPAGSSARQVGQRIHDAGVRAPAWWLHAWLRLSGQSRQIQAGSYEIPLGMTPSQLLDRLVRGEQALRRVTLVEGWNWRQVMQAIKGAEQLSWDLPESALRQPHALMSALGLPGHPEGRFFPDTYLYPRKTKASDLLRQAAAAMDPQLAQAWAQRAPGLPLQSPEQALILASVVEKETGAEADRARVAAVFVNRLRLGMRLQTDPTVIYGLGEAFDGNLRKRDLLADTPYNSYTRAGLPPTPIAMPGLASIRAALHPANSDALYFVARGDGSSHFSATLQEHNLAVRRHILNR